MFSKIFILHDAKALSDPLTELIERALLWKSGLNDEIHAIGRVVIVIELLEVVPQGLVNFLIALPIPWALKAFYISITKYFAGVVRVRNGLRKNQLFPHRIVREITFELRVNCLDLSLHSFLFEERLRQEVGFHVESLS